MDTKDSQCPYLPIDIWRNILLLLPARSLLRVKSVCKAWYCLITSRSFVKQHILSNTNAHEATIIFLKNDPNDTSDFSFDVCHLGSIMTSGEQPLHLNSLLQNTRIYTPALLGYCNGLVLIGCSALKELFLWNPLLRKYTNLKAPYYFNRYKHLCGLGYDSLTDEHKLVTISWPYDNNNQVKVLVCSIEDNVWKDVQINAYNVLPGQIFSSYEPATVLKGVPHWLLYVISSTGMSILIVCFDLETNTLKQVPLPSMFKNYTQSVHSGVLGGNLSIAYIDGVSLHIQVMKRYGDVDSWTTLYKFSQTENSMRIIPCRPLWCQVDYKEVLMAVDWNKIDRFYNIEKHENGDTTFDRTCMTWGASAISDCKPMALVESLVALPLSVKSVTKKENKEITVWRRLIRVISMQSCSSNFIVFLVICWILFRQYIFRE